MEDRSWIFIEDRANNQHFKECLNDFLEFAYKDKQPGTRIFCPCRRCKNSERLRKITVFEHVMIKGFLTSYNNWIYHGEEPWESSQPSQPNAENIVCDDIQGLIHEALGTTNSMSADYDIEENFGMNSPMDSDDLEEPLGACDEETQKFFKLLKHAEIELYPGCKSFTLLSFVIKLLHVKTLCRWSNNSMTMLLEVLKEAFPENEMFPSSYHEAWKIVKDLGLNYKKVHACPNDCMIYWKETENDTFCKHCATPRYKQLEKNSDDSRKGESKVPAKLVRYFPLKPRLQRWFMSSKTAALMRWHEEGRTKDGNLRHPADSLAWKHFNDKHPSFASDSRNVRLGLAADGFNPFKAMTNAHSTWPVILVPYNLPPWMCMKQTSFMLCLLIDGPRAPGNDIDVYLRLVIDELKELWDPGVPTYDAASKQMFYLRAALLWTINDFPAYGNLSGWSTKGKYACPYCNKDIRSRWLKHGKKHCYLGHRRFLAIDHNYRVDRVHFDGTVERDCRPTRLSGAEILEQLVGFENKFGKGQPLRLTNKRRRENHASGESSTLTYNWKKQSIFFELVYWVDNLVPHNFDIMHIEKNFLENLLWTLLVIIAKTKDNLNARYDLMEMGIRKALHPQLKGEKVYLPPACFTMSKDEKEIFCRVLKNVKVPDGYGSNISRCVNVKECSIFGLKSHDCHILIQQLLPIAIRRVLPRNVCRVIIEICDIFRQLYSKVHAPSDFEALEDRIALALCELEKIFPPSFFDIMEHLPIHLPEEAKIAGPVQFRSMYPIERYLCTLKNYVRSRSHPEGSIAEGYLAEECMTFCSRYLENIESKLNRPSRNYEGSNREIGRALGKENVISLDDISWVQAHRYVLGNLEAVAPFRREHQRFLKREKPRMSDYERERIHNETFYKWLKKHVENLENSSSGKNYHEDVAYLATGPDKWARSYSGYLINGFRFHTKKREMRRLTQNSGVLLNASANSFASSKDKNPILGDLDYYGVLTDIIELRYSNDIKFVMFKCNWVDNTTGVKQDEHKFTLVNFNHLLYKQNRKSDEPFILASQAQQVWYVQDPVEPEWNVVVKMAPRDLFDVNPEIDMHVEIQDEHSLWQHVNNDIGDDGNVSWVREGVEGVTLESGETSYFIEDDEHSSDKDDFESDNVEDDKSDDDDFFEEAQQGDDDDD